MEVTPASGKGALGTWRTLAGLGHSARKNQAIKDRSRLTGKPLEVGVYMGQHLSFTSNGKAVRVKATVRTGLGKSDRPGSQGGLKKREIRWN
jgi:hypothetical protein